jgi:hypothetical protein
MIYTATTIMEPNILAFIRQLFLSLFWRLISATYIELNRIDVIIVLMKSILGKYFYPCLVGIILEVIIVFVVLVRIYKTTSSMADSIYDFFIGNVILRSLFDFISEWAIILGIIPFVAILLLFLSDIRKGRRKRALNRIHDWAQNAVLILSDYRQRDNSLQESPLIRYEGIKVLLGVLEQHKSTALTEAKVIGGELEAKTQAAIQKVNAIEAKVDQHNESAYNDLQMLQHDLAEVMMFTFELLQKL